MNTLSFFNPRFTSDLFDVIDRNFSDYDQKEPTRVPPVDVYETKDAYVLKMELSGYTDKDIELSLKDKVLTIGSCKKEEKEDKHEDDDVYLIRERKSISFTRSFTLPDDIDAAKVKASLKNGLLEVNIPRKAEEKPTKILIDVSK